MMIGDIYLFVVYPELQLKLDRTFNDDVFTFHFRQLCVFIKFIHAALIVNESNFKILFVLLYVKLKIITTLFTIYFLSGSVPLPTLHKIPDYYYIYTTIANIYFFRIHFIFMYSTLHLGSSTVKLAKKSYTHIIYCNCNCNYFHFLSLVQIKITNAKIKHCPKQNKNITQAVLYNNNSSKQQKTNKTLKYRAYFHVVHQFMWMWGTW